MNSLLKPHLNRARIIKQRGVVLFFTLIALLAMSLAAVALIRSVDTGTMIAGNLAFKQSATSSGNAGTEASIAWLETVDAANSGLNVLNNAAHPFNSDNAVAGYYSSMNSVGSLTDGTGIQWDATDSCGLGANCTDITDNSGNTVRYIIQRMCRTANALPSLLEQPLLVPPRTDCLFSGAIQDNNGQNIPSSDDICEGAGCPFAGQSPQTRITARITGPKNTVSYVQAFVY